MRVEFLITKAARNLSSDKEHLQWHMGQGWGRRLWADGGEGNEEPAQSYMEPGRRTPPNPLNFHNTQMWLIIFIVFKGKINLIKSVSCTSKLFNCFCCFVEDICLLNLNLEQKLFQLTFFLLFQWDTFRADFSRSDSSAAFERKKKQKHLFQLAESKVPCGQKVWVAIWARNKWFQWNIPSGYTQLLKFSQ